MSRPMFQRRQYEAIADILRTARDGAVSVGDMFAVDTVDSITVQISELFETDNPRFSTARFDKAVKGSDASGR